MAFTVEQAWNRARDNHAVLSAVVAPVQLAMRQCSEFQRDIMTLVASKTPAYFAHVLSVSLPLADFTAGIDLDTVLAGGYLEPLIGEVVDGRGCKLPARFVPWEQRDVTAQWPAFTLRNNVLYLLGTEQNYTTIASFDFSYTPIPVDLVDPSDPLVLPEFARKATSDMLTAFYLMRLIGNPQYQVTADVVSPFNSFAAQSRSDLLNQIQGVSKRQRIVMRDVGPH